LAPVRQRPRQIPCAHLDVNPRRQRESFTKCFCRWSAPIPCRFRASPASTDGALGTEGERIKVALLTHHGLDEKLVHAMLRRDLRNQFAANRSRHNQRTYTNAAEPIAPSTNASASQLPMRTILPVRRRDMPRTVSKSGLEERRTRQRLDGTGRDDTMLVNETEWSAIVAGHKSYGNVG